MRLAFLDLPDDRVDLISLARQTDGVEIVLVSHPDPEALALKIAEVPMEIVQTQDRVIKTVRLFRPRASDLARAA